MLMAMPYEERLAYLQDKYKQLVWEMHGIRISDNPVERQASTGDDYAHKVAPSTVNAIKEEMVLTQTPNKWEWRLSFLERLTGDYNFDHVVSMLDVDEVGAYFGRTTSSGDWGDQPSEIDRLANEDSVISIADITPLAINFGNQLQGYNLYWQDYNGGDWRFIGEWDESHCTYDRGIPPTPPDNFRGHWEGTFTKQSIYRYYATNPIMVDTATTNTV